MPSRLVCFGSAPAARSTRAASSDPASAGVVQRGEAGDVGGLDVGAVGEQEANGVRAVVERGPVQRSAAVPSGAPVQRIDVRPVAQRGCKSHRVAGDGGIPQARLRSGSCTLNQKKKDGELHSTSLDGSWGIRRKEGALSCTPRDVAGGNRGRFR